MRNMRIIVCNCGHSPSNEPSLLQVLLDENTWEDKKESVGKTIRSGLSESCLFLLMFFIRLISPHPGEVFTEEFFSVGLHTRGLGHCISPSTSRRGFLPKKFCISNSLWELSPGGVASPILLNIFAVVFRRRLSWERFSVEYFFLKIYIREFPQVYFLGIFILGWW